MYNVQRTSTHSWGIDAVCTLTMYNVHCTLYFWKASSPEGWCILYRSMVFKASVLVLCTFAQNTHKKSSASSVGGVVMWVLADISPGLTALVEVYIVASVVAKYHLQLSNITCNFQVSLATFKYPLQRSNTTWNFPISLAVFKYY